MKNSSVYFICGVSGSGKTTIGKLLAEHLGCAFIDGDHFHPQSNIEKMKSGIPLNDTDRQGWLEEIYKYYTHQNKTLIIACSALKEQYRATLKGNSNQKLNWIFLTGSFELIKKRMTERKGHFMPDSLLKSQFDILDIPDYALQIDVSNPAENIVKTIMENTSHKSQLGLIGLGVMGKSLSRNFANNNVKLSLYNRFVAGSEEQVAAKFISAFPELNRAAGFEDLNEFVDSLQSPRKIFMMISAGSAIDSTIDALIPLLEEGDLIVDGGNSHYKLTQARNEKLSKLGIFYIGTGVSGGEEGALKGPAIMPGGAPDAYQLIQSELESIAAKDKNGKPCCGYIGLGGAGHFVKMVHNGIEYAEMQLIAEMYGILKNSAGMSNEEIADVFEEWQKGEASSYLLGITVKILHKKENEVDLINVILDKAGNKGTGSWTTIAACELGVPIPTLTAALFARYQSAYKSTRESAESIYQFSIPKSDFNTASLLTAYQTARIINHHQGLHLISVASKEYNWDIDFVEVCRIWTNGCIIRSKFMEDLGEIVSESDEVLLHSKISTKIKDSISDLRYVLSKARMMHLSVPCLSASLDYIETYSRAQSTANIIQAQRDFFGAHRYQRIDDPNGPSHHTIWES